MRAVAKRLLPSVLTAAKIGLSGVCRLEHQGLEGRFLMTAITKWLLCTAPAGAPSVRLAFHQLNDVWLFLFDDWFTHFST